MYDSVKYELVYIIENSQDEDDVRWAEDFLLQIEERNELVLGVYSFVNEAILKIEASKQVE
jgi:hypothetical protein